MNARPTYPNPANVSPELAQTMLAAASRKWVYVDASGVPFWLSETRAKAIHAKHGGELFAPERRAAVKDLLALRDATLAARAIDPAIGTSVENGLLRVNRTTYAANGTSTVEPVSGWMPLDAAVNFLRDFIATA